MLGMHNIVSDVLMFTSALVTSFKAARLYLSVGSGVRGVRIRTGVKGESYFACGDESKNNSSMSHCSSSNQLKHMQYMQYKHMHGYLD